MEELYKRGKQWEGNSIPDMGEGICILYSAADRAVYLYTGVYYNVLGEQEDEKSNFIYE